MNNSIRLRVILGLGVVFVGLLFNASIRAQVPDEEPAAKKANFSWTGGGIEGVWNARARITVCPTGATIVSFDAMSLFGGDGIFQDTNSTNPVLRSATFGYWRPLDDGRYYFAFKYFRFDAAGNPLGSTVVRHYITLSPTGDSYSSAGTAQFFDTAGNLTMNGCSTATATRFN